MSSNQPKMKMVAYNKITRRMEEVYPEDEAPNAFPVYLGNDGRYYSIPEDDCADEE